MLSWFKKRESNPAEICIPKIITDNNIEFDYQHVLEISSIPIDNINMEIQIINAVESNDLEYIKEQSKYVEDSDTVKIFSLIGKITGQKMLLAVYKPIKYADEVKLIAHRIMHENIPVFEKV